VADFGAAAAGWCSVAEDAAVGAAAIYVPFPFAVDDHQTTNANFLVKQGAGWLMPQSQLTPEVLAERLASLTREELLACAEKAWALKKTEATREVVAACEALAA
jgi:UDP-N-acetylglucosamine--N-acetylmuramyl-(pentapeptide) pyrophosphoryl-undecaprenol N-acetylglucosamine transferase